MNRSELLGVLFFVGGILSVYLGAGLFLIMAVFRRIFNATKKISKGWCLLRNVVYSLAILGIFCFLYGYFIEPFWPTVTRVDLPSHKVAVEAKGFRVVHLSDLHCEERPRLEPSLPDLVEKERPDVIIFTGDALNEPAGLPHFKRTMKKLAEIAPTFAVKGNFDAWYWNELDLFGGTGVQELSLSSAPLTLGGVPVVVWGVPVGQEYGTSNLLSGVDRHRYNIFLYHYPDLVGEGVKSGVDLCLSGHTHGGQVALPFYGALVTLSAYGKRFESGLYKWQDTWLYVNRGIGMEGGPIPRVRFFSRPEITVIDIKSTKNEVGRK